MPASVRIGLAGYGLGGRYFHAPQIDSAATCEFLGVVTTSAERRREVAADLGRPAFASLEELAGAGAEAVAISTPAATHVRLTQQALRLGLAVACDKPFAPDANSARQTVELAEQLGVPLTVYQNRRWDSDFLSLRGFRTKRIARRADPLRVAVRAVQAGVRPSRGRRRHPAGLRQPPGRPGSGARGPGQRRVRRDASPPRPRRARRRRVHRLDPPGRRAVAPVGQLAASRAWAATACHRNLGHLCHPRCRRPGSPAAKRGITSVSG